MTVKNAFWFLLGVVVVGAYVGSSAIELIVDYYWFGATGYPEPGD